MTALGVRTLLDSQPDITLAAAADTVPGLLCLPDADTLDLVLLDLRLGDGTSPGENIEALHRRNLRVLAFTAAENPYHLRQAARAGVLGVIRKSIPATEMLDAVRRACSGRLVPSTEWAAAIDGDPDIASVGLSDRQLEVLELYAAGESAQRVASITGLKVQTVHDYLGRIRLKYALAGRPSPTKTDLYKRAVEDGYLPPPEPLG